MREALLRLIWLVPTALLVGLIYAAIRSDDHPNWVRQGLRQWAYIVAGMCVLGLIIVWLSRNV